MNKFLDRLARHNSFFFSKIFREIAEKIEDLVPGSPMWASPIFFHKGEETKMGMISVPDDFAGNLTGTVTFLDEHGHETTPDDTPQWSSDNENVATVEASDDGLSGTVTITGEPGAAVISVDTTNEDGSAVHSQGTITVLPGDVVSGDVNFEQNEPEVNPQ